MARRRMFSLEIVDSDSFNEMSTEACVLYFHMVMHADNRGYVNCAKTIISNLQGANTGHLIELLNKRFVLKRKEDVYLIKHWYIHNDIPKGRVEETNYIDDDVFPCANVCSGKHRRKSGKDSWEHDH